MRLELERIPARRLLRARLLIAVCAVIAVGATSALTWPSRRAETVSIPFAERDWVLVTAFENKTGDASLDGALEYALERELANSAFVNVVPRARIEDTLQLMQRPQKRAWTHLWSGVGSSRRRHPSRNRRASGKDWRDLLNQRADLDPADGSTASVVTETSISPDDLLGGVGRVAIKIRQRLGETSLNSRLQAYALKRSQPRRCARCNFTRRRER